MPFQSPLEAGKAFSWVLLRARTCHTEKRKQRTSRAKACPQAGGGNHPSSGSTATDSAPTSVGLKVSAPRTSLNRWWATPIPIIFLSITNTQRDLLPHILLGAGAWFPVPSLWNLWHVPWAPLSWRKFWTPSGPFGAPFRALVYYYSNSQLHTPCIKHDAAGVCARIQDSEIDFCLRSI